MHSQRSGASPFDTVRSPIRGLVRGVGLRDIKSQKTLMKKHDILKRVLPHLHRNSIVTAAPRR
jgi:hypothetical protein